MPYSRHVDDETIGTKDGYVFQVLKVDGFAFETADQSEINQLKRVRNTLLMSIGSSRIGLYYHVIRREVFGYPKRRISKASAPSSTPLGSAGSLRSGCL